jgi:hypothetical protein
MVTKAMTVTVPVAGINAVNFANVHEPLNPHSTLAHIKACSFLNIITYLTQFDELTCC